MHIYCNVEEAFKKFLDPDPDGVDEFQKLISSSLAKDTTLIKLSLKSDQ